LRTEQRIDLQYELRQQYKVRQLWVHPPLSRGLTLRTRKGPINNAWGLHRVAMNERYRCTMVM
jgi:hypothetical protein